MKVCPSCAFANDESFPTCVLCHTVLAGVPSTPSSNPDDPEHEQRAIVAERGKLIRGQVRSAAIWYALVVMLTAAVPGMVWSSEILLYFLSGVIVAAAVAGDIVGQFTASFLQGAFSVVLMAVFGPLQPGIFFMLVGHLIFPAVLWHWLGMIHAAHR